MIRQRSSYSACRKCVDSEHAGMGGMPLFTISIEWDETSWREETSYSPPNTPKDIPEFVTVGVLSQKIPPWTIIPRSALKAKFVKKCF